MQATKRRFVECSSGHHASCGQLVDHHLDKANLLSREAPIIQELGERRLCGGTVQTHESKDEVGK